MSATPRDALKQRSQRLAEVYNLLYERAGQANSQCVTFGGDLLVDPDDPTEFAVGPIAYVIGQGEVIDVDGIAANVVDTGADPSSTEFLKVLIEVDAAGTVTQTVGQRVSTSQADAVLPKGSATKITLGWLELTNFDPGTTHVTAAMLKKAKYWTWTENLTPGNDGY